jgi:hypothetical protein
LSFLRAPISRRVGAGGVAITTLALGAVVELAPRTPLTLAPPAALRAGGAEPGGPLAQGAFLPPLRAAGWANGPPAPSPRLLVLDIWAHW